MENIVKKPTQTCAFRNHLSHHRQVHRHSVFQSVNATRKCSFWHQSKKSPTSIHTSVSKASAGLSPFSISESGESACAAKACQAGARPAPPAPPPAVGVLDGSAAAGAGAGHGGVDAREPATRTTLR